MSDAPRIGIYVHHHGGGHAARAGAIAAALRERGAEVTRLGSGSGNEVTLPLDTDPGTDPGETPAELHFAPLGSAGLAGRMAAIAGWINEERPDLVLVDVSVEVAMLVRLCGVPFAYLRQTGTRDDPPHRLAYGWAVGLLAPYEERHEPAGTPEWIRAKTDYVGAVTRFDGRPRPARDCGLAAPEARAMSPRDEPTGHAGAERAGHAGAGLAGHAGAERPRRVLVLGEGGKELARTIAAAAPDWEVLGPRPVDLDLLARTAVVVAPGGANTVAEAAFASCGLVCIPHPRPFGEQVARGQMLAREDAAVVLDGPPEPHRWPSLLEDARARSTALAGWADGGGASRAADYLLALARAASVPASSSQSTSPRSASSASQPLAGHSPQRSR